MEDPFEDRTADFVRNVQPLVTAASQDESESRKLLDLLNTTHPLLPDDEDLERLVAGILGRSSFKPADESHIFRIEVPIRYRGPGVEAVYPRATFRRSVAVKYRSSQVEFITPVHPLVKAIAASARKRLLQVYPDERGLPPRRLAARRVPDTECASAVFTFLGCITGGGGLMEERMIAVRITPDLRIIGSCDEALSWVKQDSNVGEVPPSLLEMLFKDTFDAMAEKALDKARAYLKELSATVREHRTRHAEVLRKDLERDLADRLEEIEEEEKRTRKPAEESGQLPLFLSREVKPSRFEAKRAAARAHASKRQEEIAMFEQIEDPDDPRPLGALFLVPFCNVPRGVRQEGIT